MFLMSRQPRTALNVSDAMTNSVSQVLGTRDLGQGTIIDDNDMFLQNLVLAWKLYKSRQWADAIKIKHGRGVS